MPDHGEKKKDFEDLKFLEHDHNSDEKEDFVYSDALVYGASTLNTDTGILTYRGGFISPDINKRLITSVIFADDVESIVDGLEDENDEIWGVFEDILSLVTVHINSACSVIGSAAFASCSSLKKVHMPSCVEIHEYAFFQSSIVSINIPGSCLSIGEHAFDSCSFLTTLYFAGTQIELEKNAFEGCIALTTINLPSMARIPRNCFYGCKSLKTTITVPEACWKIGCKAFRETSITSIIISEACEKIGFRTFESCVSLAPFKLPDNCTDVHRTAFDGCVLLDAAALKLNITVERLLRYRYRLPRFIIPSFLAFNRCDMLKAKTGSDGIGLNEGGDMMVLMYRKIETRDLWRKILGYVRPADV